MLAALLELLHVTLVLAGLAASAAVLLALDNRVVHDLEVVAGRTNPQQRQRPVEAILPHLVGLVAACGIIAALPMGPGLAPLDAGIPYIFALASIDVASAAWRDAVRRGTSRERPLAGRAVCVAACLSVALLPLAALSGDLSLGAIVSSQQQGLSHWNLFRQPLAFGAFLLAACAADSLPFTGARGNRLDLFVASARRVTVAALLVTLFLGSWDGGFGLPPGALGTVLAALTFAVKVTAVVCVGMWARWTLPRLDERRLDGLVSSLVLPLGLVNLFVTALVATH